MEFSGAHTFRVLSSRGISANLYKRVTRSEEETMKTITLFAALVAATAFGALSVKVFAQDEARVFPAVECGQNINSNVKFCSVKFSDNVRCTAANSVGSPVNPAISCVKTT
jgi:hypothetical protein